MEQIRIFENPAFGKIRTAGTSDNPLFCLADICKVLGLTPKFVNQRLDKGVVLNHPLQTAGGIQQALFVNEDGLYDVILDSRKPEAKAFRKWVTSEVLPSIRKTGGYIPMVEGETENELMARAYLVAKKTIEMQQERLAESEKKVVEMQPKADYYDRVTKSDSVFDMNEVSKILKYDKMGRNNLFEILRKKGILDLKNQPYQKYVAQGYFKLVNNYKTINGEIKTFPQTVVFQKGVDFINRILKEYESENKDKSNQLHLF